MLLLRLAQTLFYPSSSSSLSLRVWIDILPLARVHLSFATCHTTASKCLSLVSQDQKSTRREEVECQGECQRKTRTHLPLCASLSASRRREARGDTPAQGDLTRAHTRMQPRGTTCSTNSWLCEMVSTAPLKFLSARTSPLKVSLSCRCGGQPRAPHKTKTSTLTCSPALADVHTAEARHARSHQEVGWLVEADEVRAGPHGLLTIGMPGNHSCSITLHPCTPVSGKYARFFMTPAQHSSSPSQAQSSTLLQFCAVCAFQRVRDRSRQGQGAELRWQDSNRRGWRNPPPQ